MLKLCIFSFEVHIFTNVHPLFSASMYPRSLVVLFNNFDFFFSSNSNEIDLCANNGSLDFFPEFQLEDLQLYIVCACE